MCIYIYIHVQSIVPSFSPLSLTLSLCVYASVLTLSCVSDRGAKTTERSRLPKELACDRRVQPQAVKFGKQRIKEMLKWIKSDQNNTFYFHTHTHIHICVKTTISNSAFCFLMVQNVVGCRNDTSSTFYFVNMCCTQNGWYSFTVRTDFRVWYTLIKRYKSVSILNVWCKQQDYLIWRW